LGEPFFHVIAAFIWIPIQITQVIQIIQLMWTNLHGVSSSTISSGTTAGVGAGGYDGIPFIIVILIVVVLSHAVESILFGHLQDQFITGLDHSFQSGILLSKPLSIFPQPLA
jgi:uncharacterized membrane protein